MALQFSVAMAASFETPEHVAHAERLGFARAWLYDSPALYPDVWVTLADCARRTERIGLGPGVLVPSLRHPMTNAAAIAQLSHLAPGRVAVGIGSGFTGRLTLGQRPLKWSFVREYILCLKALLAGETVVWEGGAIRMMHPAGFAPERPIDVPFIIGASGPKGRAVAHEVGDGVFGVGPEAGFDWSCLLQFGTVLGDDEDPGSERVLDAAGHAAAVAIHAMYDGGVDLSAFPGGAEWTAAIETVPAAERHLALHDLHLIGLNDRDRLMVNGGFIQMMGAARTAQQWRDHLAAVEAGGTTELVYQPAGPDIEGELERFAAMAGL
jgi:5,10-methylenetetrahydromethanopterin reductase